MPRTAGEGSHQLATGLLIYVIGVMFMDRVASTLTDPQMHVLG